MTIICPHCNIALGAPDNIVAGTDVRCRNCGNSFPIPNSQQKEWDGKQEPLNCFDSSNETCKKDFSKGDYLSGVIGFSNVLLIIAILGFACALAGLLFSVITREYLPFVLLMSSGFSAGILHLFAYYVLRVLYHIGNK